MQILISSVSAQNPPALLPPRSVCPLPIYPSCRCHSRPLPGVSRKQRYNTLDFPRESRVPRKALPSFGSLPPRGTLFPSGHPACPCSGYPSCSRTLDTLLPEQVKTGTEICPDSGQISVPVFVQRRLGKAYAEALQNHRSWLEIFVLECENRLSQTHISGIIK